MNKFSANTKRAFLDIARAETPIDTGHSRYNALRMFDFGENTLIKWDLRIAPYLAFLNEGTKYYNGVHIGFTNRAFAGMCALSSLTMGKTATEQKQASDMFTKRNHASQMIVTQAVDTEGNVYDQAYTTRGRYISRMKSLEREVRRDIERQESDEGYTSTNTSPQFIKLRDILSNADRGARANYYRQRWQQYVEDDVFERE